MILTNSRCASQRVAVGNMGNAEKSNAPRRSPALISENQQPLTGVQAAAKSALHTVLSSAVPSMVGTEAVTAETAPSAPSATTATTDPVHKLTPNSPLPSYALSYAPILWLHNEEMYWPGDPFEHLTHTVPQKKDGTKIDVPDNILGKIDMLRLPEVDQDDTYLSLAVGDEPIDRCSRAHATSDWCRPKTQGLTPRSKTSCLLKGNRTHAPTVLRLWYGSSQSIRARSSVQALWISSTSVGLHHIEYKGSNLDHIADFYPYNLGNTVAFTAFGNHVGEWNGQH